MKLGKLVNLSEAEVNDLLTILDVFVPVLSIPTEWVEGWDQIRAVAQATWAFVSSEQAKNFYRRVAQVLWAACMIAIAAGWLAREVFEDRKAIRSTFVAQVERVKVDFSEWRDRTWAIVGLRVFRWEMVGSLVIHQQILNPVNLRLNRLRCAVRILRG